MNILFIKHYFCKIYGFRDIESVRIRLLSPYVKGGGGKIHFNVYTNSTFLNITI